MKIRRGDNVLVINGKERGKTGRVERQSIENNRVVIEGVNMITRHLKARPGVSQSGRVQQEAPIHLSNLMLVCNHCAQPTRTHASFLEDGKKVRTCHKCKETID